MRVWIDLANSPHVALFEPVVVSLRASGWEVDISARDHAQTLELARMTWPGVRAIGGESPSGRAAKALAIASRARALRAFVAETRPDVALSHGSYAQVVAAAAARVPAITMMDYEHQPANHVSFRLARLVVVPEIFPTEALRRFGAREAKVVRYEGFKEELYLAGYEPPPGALDALELDPSRVLAVFRFGAEGSLYHRHVNDRFRELIDDARTRPDVQVVLLPRMREQAVAARGIDGVLVPREAVDGRALLAAADLAIGGGGTMNRESALLGTPTYTMFSGRLGAVDAELMRRGLLQDLREPGVEPLFERKQPRSHLVPIERREAILAVLKGVLERVLA